MIVLPGMAGQNKGFTTQWKEVEFQQKKTLEDDKYSGEH